MFEGHWCGCFRCETNRSQRYRYRLSSNLQFCYNLGQRVDSAFRSNNTTPNASNPKENGNSGLSSGAKAGIRVGAPVILGFLRKRRGSVPQPKEMQPQLQSAPMHEKSGEPQELLVMAEQGHLVDKADEGSVWRNIFAARILRLERRQACYWIIDALDECSNYYALFHLLSKVERQNPLRIFITSRPLLAIDRLFTQEKLNRIAETISIRESLEDIRLYLQANAEILPAENEVERDRLLTQISKRSNGNFLWTCLVLQKLADTSSVQQTYEVLDSVPDGMNELYSRILEALTNNPRNRDIAKAILKWSVCSSRPLIIDEFKEALRLDIHVTLPRLELTLGLMTGNLVYVDGDSQAQLAHQTVRSFLIRDHTHGLPANRFTIIRSCDHLNIGRVCSDYLRGSELKVARYRHSNSNSRTVKRSAFAGYAVQHFSDHIARSHSDNATILSEIQAFLSSNSLTWIKIVTATKDDTNRTSCQKLENLFGQARKASSAAWAGTTRCHSLDRGS